MRRRTPATSGLRSANMRISLRRSGAYSDLIVHRALVSACRLGEGGLADDEAAVLPRTCEHISQTERRAMEAERDTMDRYIAQHLGGRVGEIVDAKVTGVAKFGLFAQVEGVGGDGILPMSALGDERFHYDETARVNRGGTQRAIATPSASG